jgi:hypothetical protein
LCDDLQVVEVTGQPGDLLIMHGRAMHARSPNCSDRVRIIGNNCLNLLADIPAERDPACETPYERSLTLALASKMNHG